MRRIVLSTAIVAAVIGSLTPALAQAVVAPPPPARAVTPPVAVAPPAAPAPAAALPLPPLEEARKLPPAKLLALANQTLIGQPRNLDYGFQLLLGPALKGDRASVRLLAKAVDANEYGFGDKSNDVLRVLGNEAMRGSSGAIIAWALIQDRGIDVPKNETKAYEWYRWAAVVGSDTGALMTSLAFAQGRGVAADKAQAMVWADRVSPARRGSAYMQLAKIFYNGAPELQDPVLAERLALQAPVLNKIYRVQAADLLSKHANNPDVLAKAQAMLRDAAADGDLKAKFYLAENDPSADGDDKDSAIADDVYAKLAASGDNEAIKIMAEGLTDQGATAESRDKVIALLKSGADHGSVEAMKALSNAYFFGLGTEVSFETAAKYYRQAADAGDAESQYQLGLMYANAIGLTKDLKQATYWLTKSADGGYKLAAASLLSLPKTE
ncbi:MAG TPA: tetratricopeptide repeat protein [Devosiaceae bacterium]|jgi:hypothetical protein